MYIANAVKKIQNHSSSFFPLNVSQLSYPTPEHANPDFTRPSDALISPIPRKLSTQPPFSTFGVFARSKCRVLYFGSEPRKTYDSGCRAAQKGPRLVTLARPGPRAFVPRFCPRRQRNVKYARADFRWGAFSNSQAQKVFSLTK